MDKICSNCKKVVDLESKFCGNCGAELNESTVIDLKSYKSKRKRKLLRILFAGFFILFMVFILANIIDYFITSNYLKSVIKGEQTIVTALKNRNQSSSIFPYRKKIVANFMYKYAVENRTINDIENALYCQINFEKRNLLKKELEELIANNGKKPSNEGFFIDTRDNQEYKWVKIGKQIWMAEDLKFVIKNEKFDVKSPKYTIGDAKRYCPRRWHLPSEKEWKELEFFLGLNTEILEKENNQSNEANHYKYYSLNRIKLFEQLKTGGSTGLNLDGMYWTSSSYGQEQIMRTINEKYILYTNFPIDNRTNLQVRCICELSESELERLYDRNKVVLYEVYDTYKDTNDPFLNIRTGPDSGDFVIFKLSDGETVVVNEKDLGKNGEWWNITNPSSGYTGYVNSRYLRIKR